jgi:hypothetical protein
MSKGLDQYMGRYLADADFRARVESDFDAAVAEFGLEEKEKQELRDYLQSDRNRSIKGTASRAFEETLSRQFGQPSPEEMKVIEERERKNIAAMLDHPADADFRAGLARKRLATCSDRYVTDESFRARLKVDFESAADELGLNPTERLALRKLMKRDSRTAEKHWRDYWQEVPDREQLKVTERSVNPEESCLVCGEAKPSFAWFRGWRRMIRQGSIYCPTHWRVAKERSRRSGEVFERLKQAQTEEERARLANKYADILRGAD